MKIHEYQAKEILRRFKVPVPKGFLVQGAAVAEEIYHRLGTAVVIVKAQIHAGGRGKGGGVRIARSPKEAVQMAREILGMQLVTHQTGPEGKQVNRLLIEQGVEIARELYLGVVLDRSTGRDVIMASTEGGMEIEKIASENPELIFKENIHPGLGMRPYQARRLAFKLGLSGVQFKNAVSFILALYKAYSETDASLAEINPLVVTTDGEVMALDAKMNFDDNALGRHPDIAQLRDAEEEEPTEAEAAQYGLNYIKLDGNVGCMVNGAGLAMATMDIIKLAGGEPANFLDVGGTASAETVGKGFNLILRDPNVRAILINIFGGIVRCDRVANGVIQAVKERGVTVPVIVRLDGTNASEAAEILAAADIDITVADNLEDAAGKVVAALNRE
ncbi:MAG: ADP-forming succinate--CoA ligase subunit beta [Candidatus Delongbacteria bacterium]|nr:ADP-forming succinate--CoA ligase subunit beta [Candidatus Delongbacteria bacterium]